MLRFSDFSHLPEVDELVQQLVTESSGLIVVAGLDSRAALDNASAPKAPQFLPSGRATIFRVLVSELLDSHPRARAVVVSEDRDVLHVARRFRTRIEFVQIRPPLSYDEAIRGLPARHPGILVIDRLTAENIDAVSAAVRGGALVVSQLDTVYHGAAVVRYLADLGASSEALDRLRWVLSVQRQPALCPTCKQPAAVTTEQLRQLEAIGARYPALAALHAPTGGGAFYAPGKCPTCRESGRQGDVAVFDFFRGGPGDELWKRSSALSMEAYVWMLAQRGQLALLDALDFQSDQLQRVFSLLL